MEVDPFKEGQEVEVNNILIDHQAKIIHHLLEHIRPQVGHTVLRQEPTRHLHVVEIVPEEQPVEVEAVGGK